MCNPTTAHLAHRLAGTQIRFYFRVLVNQKPPPQDRNFKTIFNHSLFAKEKKKKKKKKKKKASLNNVGIQEQGRFSQGMGCRAQASIRWLSMAKWNCGFDSLQLVSARHEDQCEDHSRQVARTGSDARRISRCSSGRVL